MTPNSRLPDSCRDELPHELVDLGRQIASLPDSQFAEIEPTYNEVIGCVKRRRRILALVQEALAQLRLDIKYLMFDLEATRVERDELRAQLDAIERDDYGRM